MIQTKEEFEEVYRQLESDIRTLFKLVFTHRQPVAEGDVRIASVILRKWLIEGLLGKLCNAARVDATVRALDNSAPLAAISDQPSINYFLTGGIKFNGVPICGIYNSTIPYQGHPLIPVEAMPDREFKINSFLAQKRLYFEGNFYSCGDIIKFTANKLGGAHFDTRRQPQLEVLDRAAQLTCH